MMFFYRFFYFILKIILIVIKPVLNPKSKAWLSLRSKAIEKNKTFSSSYWFHASSGEIEYCKSVIRMLKAQKSDAQIVVTYSSPSAERLFYNITEYVDQFLPLPWDQPAKLNELIDYLNPQILIFSKTDLWPELVTQAKRRNLKTGVISFNGKLNFFNTYFLRQLSFISCTDDEMKEQLTNFTGLKNITADGDTRFDQVFHRLEQLSKFSVTTEYKIFICGSTWPEDEAVLFEAFSELVNSGYKIILSPHEVAPANIERVQKELLRRKLNFQMLGFEPDATQIKFEKDVLIIDKIGFLADAYRFADVAFVGGSFKDKIHSVMEPLCCGLPVVTGPHFRNNLEAVKYHNQFVFEVRTQDEILNTVKKIICFAKNEILAEMKKNKNASEKVVSRF